VVPGKFLNFDPPIFQDLNADPDKWTLKFVTKKFRTLLTLLFLHDLQSKTKIIIEERPSQQFQEINLANKFLPSPP